MASSHRWGAYGLCLIIAAALFAAVALPTLEAERSLAEPSIISGYSMLGLFVFLGLFNLRKRLPVLPLIRAHWWTIAHVCGGVLAIAIFFLHTASVWPHGRYEQWLAGTFYFVSLSGVVGLVLQQHIPRRLTQTGYEFIYERIPEEISKLKRDAEAVVLNCTRDTGNETLARFYVETLAWFFAQPRFRLGHVTGPRLAEFWLEQRFDTVRRYLDETERTYLAELETLAEHKLAMDAHHVGQSLLRGWLSAHVPAVVVLLSLALWHLLLVHIYAL